MHKIFLVILLFFVTAVCYGQCFKPEYCRPFEGLKDKPLKYTESTYSLSSKANNKKEWQSTNKVSFSPLGFILDAETSTPEYKFTTKNTDIKDGRPLRTEKISEYLTQKMTHTFEYLVNNVNDTLDMIIVNTSLEDAGSGTDTVYLKYKDEKIISEHIIEDQHFKDLEIILDKNKNITDNKIWIDTILFMHSHHDYDKNGLPRAKTDFVTNGMNDKKTFSYEYLKFDSKGNWTECIETCLQDNSKSITIREIIYSKTGS
jgi:hypothetical protein